MGFASTDIDEHFADGAAFDGDVGVGGLLEWEAVQGAARRRLRPGGRRPRLLP